VSFRRSGNLLRPAGAKRGTKGRGTLSPHPLSTGSASGHGAAPPLHPWLHPAAPLGRKRGKKGRGPFFLICFPRVPRRAAERPRCSTRGYNPPPRWGEKGEKRAGDPFRSSAFHGFRVGPQRGPAAPPVATIRRPVGAKDGDALLPDPGSRRSCLRPWPSIPQSAIRDPQCLSRSPVPGPRSRRSSCH